MPRGAGQRTSTGRVFAVDPGSEQSALVEMQGSQVVAFTLEQNEVVCEDLRSVLPGDEAPVLAIEMIAGYGMPVGREVFETCLWIGRFIDAWRGEHHLVHRRDVKLELCGSPRAKDPNVREALLDSYGPGQKVAVGTKKAPGPLYGFKRDLWSALAVGVTWQRMTGVSPRGLDCTGRTKSQAPAGSIPAESRSRIGRSDSSTYEKRSP